MATQQLAHHVLRLGSFLPADKSEECVQEFGGRVRVGILVAQSSLPSLVHRRGSFWWLMLSPGPSIVLPCCGPFCECAQVAMRRKTLRTGVLGPGAALRLRFCSSSCSSLLFLLLGVKVGHSEDKMRLGLLFLRMVPPSTPKANIWGLILTHSVVTWLM